MLLFHVCRDAVRQCRRQPLYAVAFAGTLALAVAAATASFAVVKRAFLDPLPYADDARLVSIVTRVGSETSAVSAHILEDLRAAGAPFSHLAPIRPHFVTYAGPDATEGFTALAVSRAFFDTLGVEPAIGRTWADGDRDAVVVSWRFWERTLGRRPDAVGSRILLDGRDRTITGVMPAGFLPPYFTTADVWLPLDLSALLADPARGRRTLTIVARRADGASSGQVEAFLAAFSTDVQKRHPVVHGTQSWTAPSLRDELVGTARPALIGTAAAAVLLMLIVAANVAGLSAARAVSLRQQSAVRAALGATRARLFGERLVEGLLLSAAGSALGVWLARMVVGSIASLQDQFLARLTAIDLDASTMGIGFAVGLLPGLLAAIVSQSTVRSAGSAEALRSSRGSTGGAPVAALRSSLVMVQVAVAVVLLVGAGLLVRTVSHLASSSLGFSTDRLLTFTVTLPAPKYNASERQIQFERDLLAQLQRLPGVASASASVGFPIIGGSRAALSIFGRPTEGGLAEVPYFSVSPNFMTALGVPLKAGRELQDADDAAAPPVTLINETMARMFWPDGDALGARVQLGPGSPSQPWITVVGIVGDLRQHGPTTRVLPTAFGSTRQYSWPRRYFAVRTDGASASSSGQLRAAVRAVDPSVAMGSIVPAAELAAGQTARHRLVMVALTMFGAVSAVLCGFGLYAVVALTSRLRRREYAIRLALGAPRQGVRWLIVRQALLLAGGASRPALRSRPRARAPSRVCSTGSSGSTSPRSPRRRPPCCCWRSSRPGSPPGTPAASIRWRRSPPIDYAEIYIRRLRRLRRLDYAEFNWYGLQQEHSCWRRQHGGRSCRDCCAGVGPPRAQSLSVPSGVTLIWSERNRRAHVQLQADGGRWVEQGAGRWACRRWAGENHPHMPLRVPGPAPASSRHNTVDSVPVVHPSCRQGGFAT